MPQLHNFILREQKARRCHLPSSVSCQTMPSRFTLVPGSQGPRHSGSVARATSQVFTPTERVRTMICSQGDEMSLLTTGTRRCRGSTAGVETGDSICRERETGRSPPGGEQVSTGSYISGEPRAQGKRQEAVQVPHPNGGQGSRWSFPPRRAHSHVTPQSQRFVVMQITPLGPPREIAALLLRAGAKFLPRPLLLVSVPPGQRSDVNAVRDFGPNGSLEKNYRLLLNWQDRPNEQRSLCGARENQHPPPPTATP